LSEAAAETAWQRAKKDAAGAYKTQTFMVACTLVPTLFGAFAAIVADGEGTGVQVAAAVIGAAAALLLIFVVVFLAQLVMAPLRQRNELRDRASEQDDGKPTNVEMDLRNLHRKGNELAQKYAGKDTLPAYDEQVAQDWTDEVADLLQGNVSDEDGKKFLAAGQDTEDAVPRLRRRVDALGQIIAAAW
jgi:hypothetical protein